MPRLRPLILVAAAVMLAPLLTVTASFVGTPLQANAQTGIIPNEGDVIFSDDFSGAADASFDTSKWEDFSSCTYNSSAAFGDIDCGDNETLDGSGHLKIPATSTSGSAIRSKPIPNETTEYGVFSAWMKMPSASGYWPAFWTLNNNRGGQDTFPLGENDINETYTFNNSVYHGTGHTWTGSSSTDVGGPDNFCPDNHATANLDLSADYHKYTAKVEPGRVTWYFDNTVCGNSFLKTSGQSWGFGPDVTRDNWMILDLAVGGAGGQNTPLDPSGELLVDKVEVRALHDPNPTTHLVDGGTYEIAGECSGKLVQPNPDSNGPNELQLWPDQNTSIQRWVAHDKGSEYYVFTNASTGKAIDVAYASTEDGATIWQYDRNDSWAQQWYLEVTGVTGAYEMVSRNSGKSANDSSGRSTTGDGFPVLQEPRSGACGGQWAFTAV